MSIARVSERIGEQDGRVRPATAADATAIWENIARCWEEGQERWDTEHMPIGAPEMEPSPKALAANLALAVTAPGWQRYWVLEVHDRLVGHVDLTGGRFRSEMHVARAGIAIRRAHWGRGYGRLLMDEAIRWAWERPEIHRIELTVFAHNARARALYERLGFAEEGVARRRYRLQSRWIDDVTMALLRREPGPRST